MERFILRFRGPGAKPEADVLRIRSLPDLTIVDDSAPRMLLVETSGRELQELMTTMPGWVISAERTVPLPDPRPKVISE